MFKVDCLARIKDGVSFDDEALVDIMIEAATELAARRVDRTFAVRAKAKRKGKR